ncbi:hypothetical protein CWI42_090970 [Ordospora colligata]|uniref:Uncharacterized protein n=1 Tax=Ordospora colligata OC4 TaxID=1354746 RepID=A0A0B2UJL4_9MICR|nr:uncharacterized protein M896_090980 [Ordospora colligata OC4]KHN69170.1 hypothetical protein M896_090980 [Ordospora colligata OC4]TBU14625.1 hypothetical protein CWI41_090970 [Ordospora colligata]TBU14819.1 hypothetical protein CWI40_090980 [Ordospora colligata]TBU18142.1 hypothetical protein CWI42_090970 [Ordospora colligata]
MQAYSATSRCNRIHTSIKGMLCDKCSVRCYVCKENTHIHSIDLLICEFCFHSTYKNKCIMCGERDPKHSAHYCRECIILQKHREGCPIYT